MVTEKRKVKTEEVETKDEFEDHTSLAERVKRRRRG